MECQKSEARKSEVNPLERKAMRPITMLFSEKLENAALISETIQQVDLSQIAWQVV